MKLLLKLTGFCLFFLFSLYAFGGDTIIECGGQSLPPIIPGNSPEVHRQNQILLTVLKHMRENPRAIPPSLLIIGEGGTPKNLVVDNFRTHPWNPRREKPFARVGLGEINAGTMDSELFGHAKGSFSGATENRVGLISQSHTGTLLFEGLHTEGTAVIQAKLLRALEERKIRQVGANEGKAFDAQIISTAEPVLTAVMVGPSELEYLFRDDLYYRMATFEIRIPSVLETLEELPALAMEYQQLEADRKRLPTKLFSYPTFRMMLYYRWPGNHQELRNALERAVILSAAHGHAMIEPEDMSGPNQPMWRAYTVGYREAFPFTNLSPEDFAGPNTQWVANLVARAAEREKNREWVIKKMGLMYALVLTQGVLSEASKLLDLPEHTIAYQFRWDLRLNAQDLTDFARLFSITDTRLMVENLKRGLKSNQ